MTVAALFVEYGGVYYGMDDVEPWGWPNRDAREYAGPHPVVAHPPCERWGSYWYGGPLLHKQGRRRQLGDDGGCFAAALHAVVGFGGVLEHPANSHAWKAFDLEPPSRAGGWSACLRVPGWTCEVEQGNYGHRAPKRTWLFVGGVRRPPELIWGPSGAVGRVSGPHRDGRKKDGGHYHRRMPDRERRATPRPFRDLLIQLADLADEARP